ncbi:hypothetical protein [Prevotella sp. 10(H)]|uniref:hypothetical protein n=1 Tax=Prevotella sp. 10(H) TaxID=1158294 RepID=UPI0004A75100|nr:hypothetical protein [Prevotella sp. 10(H)]
MNYMHTISDFYTLLKLGIFTGGEITGWGYISGDSGCILIKPGGQYQNQIPMVRLYNNVYLLDFYLHSKATKNIYMMVISVSDHFQKAENCIYAFKLVTGYKFNTLSSFMSGMQEHARRRKSVFRKKANRAVFDASPLNAVTRKH